MHIRRFAGVLLGGLAFVLSGCLPEEDPNLLDVEPADFAAFSTMQRLAAAGTIRVGITGNELDAEGSPVGFEVALAEMVAGALGIADHEVTWVQTEATEHERLIEDGFVDVVLAAFPIDERSLQIVDFAGPYHAGGLRMLSAAPTTERPATAVCTTPDVAPALRDLGFTDLLADTYQACLNELEAGRIEALVAPDLVLVPHAGSRFTLEAEPVADAVYGIALPKGDDDFRAFLNNVLDTVAADGRWSAAWESTAGAVLGPAEPPPVDRY